MPGHENKKFVDANRVNEERRQEAFTEFKEHAVTVSDLLTAYPLLTIEEIESQTSMSSLLYGADEDGTRLYSTWQFDDHGVRSDLSMILEKTSHFTSDALAVDRILRLTSYEELGHKTLIEALNSEDDPHLQAVAWQKLDNLDEGF
jgi:hypothetical protein